MCILVYFFISSLCYNLSIWEKMKNIIPKLETIAQEKSNMGLLANYLLGYEGDIAELKISKICDDLYISIASATRLAKRLDLDCFSQLKIYLVNERTQNKVSTQKYTNISSQKYFDDIVVSLNTTLNTVDLDVTTEVSNEIMNVSRVNFYAVGGSHVIVTDFAQKLARLKIQVNFYGDAHLQYVEAANSDNSAVSVGLSYSGLTQEILDNLSVSKKMVQQQFL